MRFSTLFVAAAAPFLTAAAPLRRTPQIDAVNIVVLQFAEVLEQLETEFYKQALSKFQAQDFTTAGISLPDIAVQGFQNILSHESTHVTILDGALSALGAQPVQGCTFNFDTVLTDVATMAAVARVVEHVGVAAYMGGADLLTDNSILAAAAQILPIEARHQSFLNTIAGATNVPQAFDIALSPGDVLSIASAFVGGCDLQRELGLRANVPLKLLNQGQIAPGTLLQFEAEGLSNVQGRGDISCQMMVGDGSRATAIPLALDQCIVPSGINGPVWVWITSNSNPLAVDIHVRDASTILAGPTAIFLDGGNDALGALVRSVNANGSVFQSSNVISPAEAASLLSSATNPSATESVNGGESSLNQQNQNQNLNNNQNQNNNESQLNQSQLNGSQFNNANNVSPNGSTPPILDLGIHFIPSSAS